MRSERQITGRKSMVGIWCTHSEGVESVWHRLTTELDVQRVVARIFYGVVDAERVVTVVLDVDVQITGKIIYCVAIKNSNFTLM
jgi:hypothetical protein